MGKSDFCDSAFERALKRFPKDSDLYRSRGFALLNLHRAAEAVTAFQMAENLLGWKEPSTLLLGGEADWAAFAKKKSVTLLLAGEAASNWAAGAKKKSVAAYVRLIDLDEHWANPSFVTRLDLTDAEKQPLLKALAEALRQHPEFKPQ